MSAGKVGPLAVGAVFLSFWDRLRASFWFVPSLMAAGGVAGAFLGIYLDERLTDQWLKAQGWIYAGAAEGAIAGSMITIAGVVFSMTLVTLSLASSQLGPRLLRNFITDKSNQAVLGTFVATFLYSLIVLRAVRGPEEDFFVPHLSITLAVLLAVASLGVLIHFIHHVSVSIQADVIITRVGAELMRGIERLFPETLGRSPDDGEGLSGEFSREAAPIEAAGDGYLQLIDGEALMALAVKEDLVLRVELRPGHFVVRGRPLASAFPGGRVDDRLKERIRAAFVLGDQRTPVQDIEFAVNQLVEIAVRALSPGVNNPFTAMACVDWIGAALCRLGRAEMPSTHRHDGKNRLRVVAPAASFAGIADTAFDQVRQSARSSAAVTLRLLETISLAADFTPRAGDLAVLRRHAEMIARAGRELPEVEDRRSVESRYGEVLKALGKAGGNPVNAWPAPSTPASAPTPG